MTFPSYPCIVEDIVKADKCKGKQEPKGLQFDDCHRQHQLQTKQLLRPESPENFFNLMITRYKQPCG